MGAANLTSVICRHPPSLAYAGQVYISGVRGLSTAWINAAVSQRVELTCDADACGAKVGSTRQAMGRRMNLATWIFRWLFYGILNVCIGGHTKMAREKLSRYAILSGKKHSL